MRFTLTKNINGINKNNSVAAAMMAMLNGLLLSNTFQVYLFR